MDGRMGGKMDEWKDNGWMEGWRMDGRMVDGCKGGGWMGGWRMDGRMADGWKDGWMGRCIMNKTHF